jgi:hypothetical protein
MRFGKDWKKLTCSKKYTKLTTKDKDVIKNLVLKERTKEPAVVKVPGWRANPDQIFIFAKDGKSNG